MAVNGQPVPALEAMIESLQGDQGQPVELTVLARTARSDIHDRRCLQPIEGLPKNVIAWAFRAFR